MAQDIYAIKNTCDTCLHCLCLQAMPNSDSAMFYFKTNKLGFKAEFLGLVKLAAALANLGGMTVMLLLMVHAMSAHNIIYMRCIQYIARLQLNRGAINLMVQKFAAVCYKNLLLQQLVLIVLIEVCNS